MKTITTTIQTNKLKITHDQSPDSPRQWDNLGYFITIDQNYNSPDDNKNLIDIVKDTGYIADDLDSHIKLITERIEVESIDEEKVIAIYPVSKYKHGGVVYKLGAYNGFDYSNNGFYIITDKTVNNLGTPFESFEVVIKDELDIYNKYINGEVYYYTLYDDNGDIEDECGGFYDLDEIKANLPKDWQDENMQDYLINNN